jgi:hypothetical protein
MNNPDFKMISTFFLRSFSMKKFRADFNLKQEVVTAIWRYISHITCLKPVHLLYALYFLNCYSTNIVSGNFFSIHPDTYVKYVNIAIISLFENLPYFPWDNRFETAQGRTTGIVDVTRCRIHKPPTDERRFYSMKDKFHALKYEVAVTINSPYSIIMVNGPYTLVLFMSNNCKG